MLETITGSATMSYVTQQESLTGWYFAAFIGTLLFISLLLSSAKDKRIRVLKHCNNFLEKKVVRIQ